MLPMVKNNDRQQKTKPERRTSFFLHRCLFTQQSTNRMNLRTTKVVKQKKNKKVKKNKKTNSLACQKSGKFFVFGSIRLSLRASSFACNECTSLLILLLLLFDTSLKSLVALYNNTTFPSSSCKLLLLLLFRQFDGLKNSSTEKIKIYKIFMVSFNTFYFNFFFIY